MKLFGELTLKTAVRITSVSALAAAIALGVGISPASAQSRKYRDVNPYGNGRTVNTNRNEIQRQAMINGYTEGFEEGTRARRDRRNSDFRRTSPYRNGECALLWAGNCFWICGVRLAFSRIVDSL